MLVMEKNVLYVYEQIRHDNKFVGAFSLVITRS